MKPATRREFLGATASLAAAPPPASRRPNVILIITDDHDYGDLSCHGNPHLRTPNLDRLPKEGVELTRFHVSPVCAPTRSSLMTGRYNYRTGVTDTYLGRAVMHPEEVTMAEMFSSAGYRTGIFGKWHLGDNYPMRAMDQGFQECLVHNGGGIGQPSDPPGNRYFDPILQHNGREEKHLGYCTDIFANAAMAFIEQNRSRPFLAYLAPNAPHTPLEIADEWVAPYRQMGLPVPTAKVYGMIANIDFNVGRLLDRVRALGLERDTIVIFLTDNGAQADPTLTEQRYNAGYRGRKGTVYEGGIHVPCFVRWPQQLQAGRKVDRIAAHIDLLPTLLEACGVAKPADAPVDGKSLMPLLKGEPGDWPDRTLFFQWHRGDEPVPFRSCAALTQQFKLVDGKELYDLAADPGEGNDVSARHPDVVARLRKAYEDWLRDVSSTRGYDPPRIHIGTGHENPVTLTRQDWRGPRAGWTPDSLGHWEVNVIRTAKYEITLRFAAAPQAGEIQFRLGSVTLKQPVERGLTACRWGDVTLEAGKAQVEPCLEFGEKTVGVDYVDIRLKS